MTEVPRRTEVRLEMLRQTLATMLQGLEHPALGAGVALAEECGEVARLLLEHHVYGALLDRQKLGGELIDVVICVCEIATRHQIDLDAACQEKLEDLATRIPKWRDELAANLALARARENRGKT